MTDIEIAWISGIIEGEGCISFHTNMPNSVCLSVRMTDRDVIEKLHKITGVGNFYVSNTPSTQLNNWKPSYQWSVSDRNSVVKMLEEIRPHMGARRGEKIDEALQRLQKNRGVNLPIEHGTRRGYKKELLRGVDPCTPCRDANSRYSLEQYHRRKAEQKCS